MTVSGNPAFAPPPMAGVPGRAQSRPTTLTLGYFGALAAGLFTAIGAILLMVNARSVAEQTAADVAADLGLSGSDLLQSAVDDAASTLMVRGVMGLVSGLLIIAIALASRNGALWARIVLAVLLLGGLCANGLVVSDVAPGASKALDIVAILLSVVVVVLMFLPPTNQYAKSPKG